ncbi:pfs domain-containing protein [Seiridium cupressi]
MRYTEAKDMFGRTPLFYATKSKVFSKVLAEILLLYGAQVNHADKDGKTPLCLALEQGGLSLATRLLEWDKITLINLAMRYGRDHDEQQDRLQMVGTLLRCGIDIQVTNEIGRTAFHIAAATGCIAVIKFLKCSRVMVERVDNNGDTPLSLAAHGGWRDITSGDSYAPYIASWQQG